jgi:hypothetical protein
MHGIIAGTEASAPKQHNRIDAADEQRFDISAGP